MRRLKILWLSHFVPYPPKGGAFQRSFNLIRGVAQTHELHLLALRHKLGTHPVEETRRAAEELGKFCESVELIDGTPATSALGLALRAPRLLAGVPLTASVSDLPRMRAAVRATILRQKFDLVHFDTIGLAGYLDDVEGTPAVACHHGAESFMMLRRTKLERNPLKRLLFQLEGRVLRRYEANFCPRFVNNLVVSDFDAHLLSQVAPNARFTVVPNGVDTTYFHKMRPVSHQRVIFAGRLDQYSNRDAILYFAKEVWPGIQSLYPNAVLDILGSNPPKELLALAHNGSSIKVHGFVADVRPHFEAATVAVCPIRDGGGTRVKILDNLAMGKPIVATTIGIEGIDVRPERDLLVADSPSEFVAQVTRVFNDEALRQQLSANARQLAEDKYSWTSIVSDLLAAYERASSVSRPAGWHASHGSRL